MAATAVMLVLLIVLVRIFLTNSNSLTVEEELNTWFGVGKITYPAGSRLSMDDDGIVWISAEGEKKALDSKPLYRGDTSVLLPASWIWMDTHDDSMNRVETFSELIWENSSVTIDDAGNRAEGAHGFLYDGADTYILLENGILTCGEETMNLAPLSFIVARHGQEINVYSRRDNEAMILDPQGTDAVVQFENKTSISLQSDTLNHRNGSWMLLMSRPEIFDRIE